MDNKTKINRKWKKRKTKKKWKIKKYEYCLPKIHQYSYGKTKQHKQQKQTQKQKMWYWRENRRGKVNGWDWSWGAWERWGRRLAGIRSKEDLKRGSWTLNLLWPNGWTSKCSSHKHPIHQAARAAGHPLNGEPGAEWTYIDLSLARQHWKHSRRAVTRKYPNNILDSLTCEGSAHDHVNTRL